MEKQACSKCGNSFESYWLTDGMCNGCRNPHLIVKAVVSCYDCGKPTAWDGRNPKYPCCPTCIPRIK